LVDLAAALSLAVPVDAGYQTSHSSLATLAAYLASRDAIMRRLGMFKHAAGPTVHSRLGAMCNFHVHMTHVLLYIMIIAV
jgi:hypothetical protein